MECYTYYVGTLSRYVLIKASNASAALEAGERHPDLHGSPILTVRIATRAEIELQEWHDEQIGNE